MISQTLMEYSFASMILLPNKVRYEISNYVYQLYFMENFTSNFKRSLFIERLTKS